MNIRSTHVGDASELCLAVFLQFLGKWLEFIVVLASLDVRSMKVQLSGCFLCERVSKLCLILRGDQRGDLVECALGSFFEYFTGLCTAELRAQKFFFMGAPFGMSHGGK